MRKLWLWEFVSGCWNTWRIKRTNPGLYKFLAEYEFDPADFEEVAAPGEGRLLVSRESLERLRKLGEEGQQK